jgi:hypothetical protein
MAAMARRAPSAVRNERARPHPIDGLSAAAIRKIEDAGLSSASVARALTAWRRTVHGPVRNLIGDGCPCCDPADDRDLLAAALLAVRGRELAALVEPLDAAFEQRTLADPNAPATLPWWRRRC